MKILVIISQTQDTEAKIQVSASGDSIDTEGMKWIMNPYDEFAIEEAIQTKEKHGGEVVIVAIGPARVIEIIRQALAMGADSAVHINGDSFADTDSFATGKLIASEIKKLGEFDVIFTGMKIIDEESGQVGIQVAEELGIPHVSLVSKVIEINADARKAVCQKEIDGGHVVVEVPKLEKLPDYLMIAMFQTTLMFGLMLYGMKYVTAGKTSVLLYTMPIWTIFLVHFYLKERLNRGKWLGVALGTIGIVCILGWDTLVHQNSEILFGELLIIGGAISWAVSNIWVKKRMGGENIYMVSSLQLSIGAIGLALLAIPTEGILNIEWNAYSIYILLFTGLIASAVDFTIWFYLLKNLDIKITTFSSMLVPVFGLIFDWAILGNRLDGGVIVGGALILIGIYQVSRK